MILVMPATAVPNARAVPVCVRGRVGRRLQRLQVHHIIHMKLAAHAHVHKSDDAGEICEDGSFTADLRSNGSGVSC